MRFREFVVGQFIKSSDLPRGLRVSLFGEPIAALLDETDDGKGSELPLRVLAVNRETGEITIGAKFKAREEE